MFGRTRPLAIFPAPRFGLARISDENRFLWPHYSGALFFLSVVMDLMRGGETGREDLALGSFLAAGFALTHYFDRHAPFLCGTVRHCQAELA